MLEPLADAAALRGDAMKKTPAASRVVMTETVLPGDGNPIGTAFGGKIAQWIDVAAAIACQRHCRERVVTASMDDLHFLRPIRVGMIVELRAQVNATFRTSMESGVRIESEDPLSGERQHVCTAFLTFVAQDEHGRPLRFGQDRNRGLRLSGFDVEVATLGNGVTIDDLIIHDERAEHPNLAFLLSRLSGPDFPECLGIFRRVERPTIWLHNRSPCSGCSCGNRVSKNSATDRGGPLYCWRRDDRSGDAISHPRRWTRISGGSLRSDHCFLRDVEHVGRSCFATASGARGSEELFGVGHMVRTHDGY